MSATNSVLIFCAAIVSAYFLLKPKRIPNKPPFYSSNSLLSLFVGSLPEILESQAKQAMPDFLASINDSVSLTTLISLVGSEFLILARPDIIKSVLVRQNEFKRDSVLQGMFHGIGEWCLFVIPTNETWFRHRKLLQPAFGPTHLRYGFECTTICFNEIASSWKAMINGSTTRIDIHKHFACVTLDIIGKVAFSYEFNLSANVNDFNLPMFEFLDHLDVLITKVQKRFRPRFLWYISGLESWQLKKETDNVFGCIKSVIASKKAQYAKNPMAFKDKKKMDVLDRLLLSEDVNEQPFNDEELKDEVFAFVGAGHETTTNSLTWIILSLHENPVVMARMVAEIDSIFKPNHEFSMEDLSLLHFTECVIKESLRLNPVAPFFSKCATADADVGEYRIAKGTTVFINIFHVQRNPKYWDDPMKFNPSRWGNGFVPITGSYLPFGDGLTNCIGQKLAMIEMKVILARLYHEFKVDVVEGQDLTPVCSITRGLKHGLQVDISSRF